MSTGTTTARSRAPAPPEPTRSAPTAAVAPPVAAIVPLAGFLVFLGLSVVFESGRLRLPWEVSFAIFAAAVVLCGLVATWAAALLLAACAWLDYDGFVVGHEGALHWHGTTDVLRLGVLVGCAVAAILLRRLRTRLDRESDQ